MIKIRFSPAEIKLFFVSFFILFLEIALVRYIGTEIRIFAYLSNLVLLACFLGFGMGCYLSHKKIELSFSLFILAALLLLVSLPLHITLFGSRLRLFRDTPLLLSAVSDSVIWAPSASYHVAAKVILGLLATSIIISMILLVFIPLGQLLGLLFDEISDGLKAYSINVVGSLAGLWVFSALCFIYTSPWLWFLIVFAGFAALTNFGRKSTRSLLALFALAVALAGLRFGDPPGAKTLWSPYQKLQLFSSHISREDPAYIMGVNNTSYMLLSDLSDSNLSTFIPPSDLPKRRHVMQYDIPYFVKPSHDDVLVVGAGGGNDIAAAVRNGAKRVTAVEIDPGILKMGRQYHPEHPYSRPEVEAVVDDARSYIHRTERKFDLVIFGLLDSHTLSSSLNNVRLDHYVYTQESFQDARRILKPDGVIVVSFEASREWISARIKGLLETTFGTEPIVFHIPIQAYAWGGTMYIAGNNPAAIQRTLAQDPVLGAFIRDNAVEIQGKIRPTSDDWPYLYLQTNRIPKLHLLVSLAILSGFLIAWRKMVGKADWSNLHFFFLGVGFLLLEFQNISKTSLLFGSTWIVNTFTISSILVLILAANFTVIRLKKINLNVVYGLLLAFLTASYFAPIAALNQLDFVPRFFLTNFCLNLPIYFAGIVFARSLNDVANRSKALGANLLGAGLGGVLESLSFVTGIRALLIVVILSYMGSYFFLRRASRPGLRVAST